MQDSQSFEVSGLQRRLEDGLSSSTDELVALVYDELRRLAAQLLRDERRGHTLQATALVHEVFLRLVDQRAVPRESREHFLAFAATLIRRVLVDHARARGSAKRGGGAERLLLEESIALADGTQGDPLDFVALHEALERLAARSERQARVVELRFFGGLGVEDTARVLGVSERTVKDDWRFARAWLHARLVEGA